MARKKHKKKSSIPRRKRFKRPQRLDSAKTWLKTYTGNKVVKAYRNRFDVDWQCAFIELEMLGVKIDPQYKHQVLQSIAVQNKAKKKKKAEQKVYDIGLYQDDRYAFIVGYTSCGFPYGITWEEMELMSDDESKW